VTFFTAQRETGSARAVAGVPGTIVALIAGVAALVGLLVGLVLR
jgi:hypothetical protein